MRNVEKIRSLEKELGKYQKKVADQGKLIDRLTKELESALGGARQLQVVVDGLLTAVALEFGDTIKDEETGAELGHRLMLSMFDALELRKKYEVRARRDEEAQTYVLGIVPREGAEK